MLKTTKNTQKQLTERKVREIVREEIEEWWSKILKQAQGRKPMITKFVGRKI